MRSYNVSPHTRHLRGAALILCSPAPNSLQSARPSSVGKKRTKRKGPSIAAKLPKVFPTAKCKLRQMKLERIKDFLLMEEEFISNQEELRPKEEREEAERDKVEDLRGTPLTVGTLEEMIDDNHAIVSSTGGPDCYVSILSFVDAEQLEPGCSVLLHHKTSAVVGILADEADPLVNVMKVDKAPLESYADIGGLEKQIQEIKEAVELPLTHPEMYEDIGIKPPKGVILYGEPGTGKTLLAKAVANQTSATFLRVVGSELIQKYLGDGPKLVREIFRLAEEHAPSIVFIDEVWYFVLLLSLRILTTICEQIDSVGHDGTQIRSACTCIRSLQIDAVGTKRYDSQSGGEREIQRTMLELLNQLDGFDERSDVKVVSSSTCAQMREFSGLWHVYAKAHAEWNNH